MSQEILVITQTESENSRQIQSEPQELSLQVDIEHENSNQIQSESENQDDIRDINKSKKNSIKTPIEFEMIQSRRRDCQVLHSITEHQLYVRNRKLVDGSIAYTCQVKKCRSRVYVKDNHCYFSNPFQDHMHSNKEMEIKDMKVFSQIKECCASPIASQTTSQISEVREIFENTMIK